ncbi:MAG: dihydrofolate reductase family protein [Microcella sp.]|uniref:dihydrofolate reductase family protein n=1 Tax=Microcella sp. TaxID=1913979 RepID=UPI0024CC173B|nr:dihydrofolate reductase family protein [Microcella sp.]UYN83548.1 MAG: dihydrofolate reductase family protein [Microcella sp.]
MSRIVYSVMSSLDGYNTDAEGDFSWAFPPEPVVASLIADAQSVSTYLYGRRMYETMAGWETDPTWAEGSPESANFAELWQRADKVVFSRTLTEVSTQRTRLEPEFTVEALERARAEATGDLTIEGPTLAAEAFRLGLIDVVEVLVCPVIIGGGLRVFPDGVRLDLNLTREKRFENGMVQLTYERRNQ